MTVRMVTRADVLSFIVSCINASEADGHEIFEEDMHEVPDEWAHDNSSCITMTYGDEMFEVRITKCRVPVQTK
jgi:hypothetical protein